MKRSEGEGKRGGGGGGGGGERERERSVGRVRDFSLGGHGFDPRSGCRLAIGWVGVSIIM